MLGWSFRKRRSQIANELSLIQEHFRPRMGKIPIFGDDSLKRLTMPVVRKNSILRFSTRCNIVTS